ncbi:hypothetical protein OWR21_00535 [Ralstonia sp. 1B3]
MNLHVTLFDIEINEDTDVWSLFPCGKKGGTKRLALPRRHAWWHALSAQRKTDTISQSLDIK